MRRFIHAFRLLAYSAFIGFLMVSCGDLVMSASLVFTACPLPVIATFTLATAKCQLEQKVVRVVMFYGIILVVTVMFTMCIERTCATYMVAYERRKHTRLGVGLLLLAVRDIPH